MQSSRKPRCAKNEQRVILSNEALLTKRKESRVLYERALLLHGVLSTCVHTAIKSGEVRNC